MKTYRWSEVKKEQLNPQIGRQMIHGATMTVGRFDLKKGASVPVHSHHNEQISTVEKGKVRFVIGGEQVMLGEGESLVIPANVPHSSEALEDALLVELFSPPREDWIRGDDAYLRK